MYTRALPAAPAPTAGGGSAAQPVACRVCGEALGGAPAHRRPECACGPFHRACALPRCSSQAPGHVARGHEGAWTLRGRRARGHEGAWTLRGRRARAGPELLVGATRVAKGAGPVRARETAGQVPRVPGEEQQHHDTAEQGRGAGGEEKERQRRRMSAPQEGRMKCEHNRRKNECKDCGGASICQHNCIRSKCKDCGHLPA